MRQLTAFFLLVVCHNYIQAVPDPHPKIRSFRSNGDVGDPLFLTPYIEGGKIQEGQAAARVQLPGSDIPSFSGYLTVNKTYNSNLFFWFFPSETDPKNAPVVLWLQGGPGGSSLFGLFCENGAYYVDKELNLNKRKYYWSSSFNVIYIDNPVGTGFSFTENDAGYATDQVKIGKDLYSALIQFFQLFPYLQKNDFFVSGESYAGKYIPAIGYTIHNNNKINNLKINLKGLAIGDGFMDPENMMVFADYFYQHGFVDFNTRESLRKLQDEIVKNIKNKQYEEALVNYDGIFIPIDPYINIYNYIKDKNFTPGGNYDRYVQSDAVRKAIHVGDRNFNNGSLVKDHLVKEFMQSVKPWVEELIENYRMLFYNGELDVIVAYPVTVNYLEKLKWSGAEMYKKASRKPWMVQGQLAGYSKTVGIFTEVLVMGAGHLVPQDQPMLALDLISRFVYNKPF